MTETSQNSSGSPSLSRLQQVLREEMPLLRDQYQVRSLGLFGSYVRGEEDESSDVDMLVEFEETPSLLRFIALENYLTDLLAVRVDLVMRAALKPHIGEHILREVVLI